MLFIKYTESPTLSEQFQLEYQELMTEQAAEDLALSKSNQELLEILSRYTTIEEPTYFLSLASLLEKQAIYSIQAQTMTAYFLFQGNLLGKLFTTRISCLFRYSCEITSYWICGTKPVDVKWSRHNHFQFSLGSSWSSCLLSLFNSNKNELRRLAELTLHSYF